MSNCQDKPTFLPEAVWKALMNLPALRYMKAPVNTEAELYEKYPIGNEKGTFAFVHNDNTFYTYHPRGWNRGRWKPISADSVSSFFEIDAEFLKEGDILVYDSGSQKFVVKSGNVWNKLIDKASSVIQVNRFFNEVEEIPTNESDAGIYFVHKNVEVSNKTIEFRALYIVLNTLVAKKVVKIWNSSDYLTATEVQGKLDKKANQTQVDDIAASVDVLAVTKAEKSVVDAILNGYTKQPAVDTYNDTSGGKTSLASVYGLTQGSNGSNGVPKQVGWDVLVRDENTRYNWNGTKWVDMESGVYDEGLRVSGYLLAGNTPVTVTLAATNVSSEFDLKIVIPIASRVSARNFDKTLTQSAVLEKTINNPVYLYYNKFTSTFGLMDVANLKNENIDYVILGFITRLANQVPLINCAWWTFNGIEQTIKEYKVRLEGNMLAGVTPVDVKMTPEKELTITIPAYSRISAKEVDITTSEVIVIQKTINNPVYFYYNISTNTFGLLDVQNLSDEDSNYIMLGFITRLSNQTPIFNCAWWVFNDVEQRHKSYYEIGESSFLLPSSEFKSFPHGAILDLEQYPNSDISDEVEYYIRYMYNTDTRCLIMVANQYLNAQAQFFLPNDKLEGGIQWVDLSNPNTGRLFARMLVDPDKLPKVSQDFEKKFKLRINYIIPNDSLPFLFPDSNINPVIRESIIEFKQLPTATIYPDAQYYLRYMYNMPEGSSTNARFLLLVCNQYMTTQAQCFLDKTHLEGIQWVDLINPNTKVPFARALIDADKIPEVSIDFGKDFHLRLIPTNSAINENESIVWFGDSVMANRSTIVARTGAILGMPADQCAVGGSRFSEREQPNTEATKWHKFDMCILVDAIISGDFSVQEEAAQWLADNVHTDFLYIVNMIAKLKTIDFSTKTIVIFSFGTNDFTGLNLLGDADSTDKKTIRGAIKYVIDKLIGAYPNLKVYFTSPTHRYFQSDLQQSSDVVPNSIGLYLIQYVDAIKEQANLLHYPVLDMYRESGLNKYNHRRYFADGVHPNEVGNEYFSKLISAFINGKITLK